MTRTRLDRTPTSGLGPDLTNCETENSLQVHLTTWKQHGDMPTVDSTRLRYVPLTKYLKVSSQMKMPCTIELGKFRSFGLGFGLEQQTPELGLVTWWTRTRSSPVYSRLRLADSTRNTHRWRCLVLGKFRSLGLGFGLKPQTHELGLGLVTWWTRTRSSPVQ